MNRRGILRLAIAVGVPARASSLRAQSAAAGPRSIGVLAPSTGAKEEVTLKPFFDEMHRLGWIEGQTIAYDRAYADDRHQDLPRLAAELVARKPALIYAPPTPATLAASHATRTIPIVFAAVGDPVGTGLVKSLAHPGGNVTGVVSVIDSLVPKRVGMLREIQPSAKRFGFLSDPTDPRSTIDRSALAPVALARKLTIVVAEASNPVEFDAAMFKLIGQSVDAIISGPAITANLRERMLELANQKRVPVIGHAAYMAEAGALFAYGASRANQLRRSAQMVDKVLRGAKPADIAVEQPTKFELVINLKAARMLGITIPKSLLLRADEVIQ
jgi:putative ABC transport system substrate-binding protein